MSRDAATVPGDPSRRFGLLGVGAAACVACCAGPILAFLGGLGVVGLVSSVAIGIAGLVGAGLALGAIVVLRRRSQPCAPSSPGVAVSAPGRKP